MSFWRFNGGQSIDWTVGIAMNQGFTEAAFVTWGQASLRPAMEPVGLGRWRPMPEGTPAVPRYRSGQWDQLGGSADQVGFIQLPTFSERQMHRFDDGLL